MANPPAKTLSPAELAKLEHAFATEPSSAAYKPLAEAYLSMSRFMEAMVVCKKGVKAHPTSTEPRLLLSKVYADQGKDRKALDELLAALLIAPSEKAILRSAAVFQRKLGEVTASDASLLKAFAADRSDTATLALFAEWKLEIPKPPPVAVPVQARVEVQRSLQSNHPVLDENPVEVARLKASNRRLGAVFFLVALVGTLGLGGDYFYGQWKGKRTRQVNKLLEEATKQLKHDSYDSYKKACESADKALDLDSTSSTAQSYLAYAYAIRWGEHGGGDDARQKAERHLEEARKGRENSSYFYAARALIQTYAGKGREALGELEQQVKAFDGQGKASSLLYLTLGLIQMNAGDLEHARDNLEKKAQPLATDDPRVYAALGTLYRRRGESEAAWKNFDLALRFERDHPESMLGRALLILDQPEPKFDIAAKAIRKLIDAEPPPSPRQLAAAHFSRALLLSRASKASTNLTAGDQRKLSEMIGSPLDKSHVEAEVRKEEDIGLSLDNKSPELKAIRARRLLFEGQLDAAISELREAIKVDPSRAQFYVELARALLQKPGGAQSAQQALITALRVMGDSPKLVVMLGDTYRQLGNLDEAIVQYSSALSDPKSKNPEARFALGAIYFEKKDLYKAQVELENAAQEFLGDPTRVASAYTQLGRVFEAKGDRPKADETFQRAFNADPDFAPQYFYYAKFLTGDRKQTAKALTTAQEYLRRDPKGPFAAEAQRMAGGGT